MTKSIFRHLRRIHLRTVIALAASAALALIGCNGDRDGTGTGKTGQASDFLFGFDREVDMVFVEGGAFRMGCTGEQVGDCLPFEIPAKSVTVSDFYIGRHEVTQRLWRRVMNGSNPSNFKGDNLPVERVSWEEVQEFIAKLNALTSKNFRLPTEAEWEYAARGGTLSKGYKYAGGNDLDDVAWHGGNSGDTATTHPVGTKTPNELGIYDMSGNVWEFVSDWWRDIYISGDRVDPQGPQTGEHRVMRGGSFNRAETPTDYRVSNRDSNMPDKGENVIGFRLAHSF